MRDTRAVLDFDEKLEDLDAMEKRMQHNIAVWDGGGRECGMVRMLSRDALALIAEVRRLRSVSENPEGAK